MSYRSSLNEIYGVVFLGMFSYCVVNGEIIASPKDTETAVGDNVELGCTGSGTVVEWHHILAGTEIHEIVYKDGCVYNGYKGRFNATGCSSADGECNLVIQNVSLSDAGTYICKETSAEASQKAAQLIVFELYPSNRSCNAKLIRPPECSTMELSCNMRYSGGVNIGPFMVWLDAEGNQVPSAISHKNGIITSTIQLNASYSNSSSYTCQVKYKSNYVISRYKWTFQTQEWRRLIRAPQDLNQLSQRILTITIVVLTVIIIIGLIGFFGFPFLYKGKKRRGRTARSYSIKDTLTDIGLTQLKVVSNVDIEKKDSKEETPLVKDEDLDRTHLREFKIEPKKKCNKKKAIYGISVLDDKLFLSVRSSSVVEVFDLKSYSFVTSWTVVDLVDPGDMASSSILNSLFICDWRQKGTDNVIFQVGPEGNTKTTWIAENMNGRLSVTDGVVIVAESWYNTIKEYHDDGKLLNKVSTPVDKLHLWHAIKLRDGKFVASFGDKHDYIHEVCILSPRGVVLEIFANNTALPNYKMKVPRSLAVDKYGTIYVADLYNKRIIVLSADLKPKKVLMTTENKIRGPQRICIHESNSVRRLLMGDNNKDHGLNTEWQDGEVLIFRLEK